MSEENSTDEGRGDMQGEKPQVSPVARGRGFKRVQLALLAGSLEKIDFEFDAACRDGLVKLQAP
jgi:hypothetical protein